jgi:hypothetical protein
MIIDLKARFHFAFTMNFTFILSPASKKKKEKNPQTKSSTTFEYQKINTRLGWPEIRFSTAKKCKLEQTLSIINSIK